MKPPAPAKKRTPIDALTKNVLVLLPGIMTNHSASTPIREKVRLAYETAAELEAAERDLRTAWANDESSEWAIRFWSKYEMIK